MAITFPPSNPISFIVLFFLLISDPTTSASNILTSAHTQEAYLIRRMLHIRRTMMLKHIICMRDIHDKLLLVLILCLSEDGAFAWKML